MPNKGNRNEQESMELQSFCGEHGATRTLIDNIESTLTNHKEEVRQIVSGRLNFMTWVLGIGMTVNLAVLAVLCGMVINSNRELAVVSARMSSFESKQLEFTTKLSDFDRRMDSIRDELKDHQLSTLQPQDDSNAHRR